MPNQHVILGLWPIAGVSTAGVTPADGRDTIAAAIDAGVTTFDTAFSYGYDGESDRLIGEFLPARRERFRLIGKVGQRWTPQRQRIIDGSPQRLIADAETSLARIGSEHFDLLMLHGPDPNVPIEISAGALERLRRRGLCRQTGVCNVTAAERARFASAAPCDAIQCPLNLLQRQALHQLIPDAAADGCEVHVYWTLMKGLLAGKISREHRFATGDSRPNYPIFQGEARRRTHDLIDAVRPLAEQAGLTVAQLSIGWALAQPGVTAALVGARRGEQIAETALARPLSTELTRAVDQWVERTAEPTT